MENYGLKVTYTAKSGKGNDFLKEIFQTNLDRCIRVEDGCLMYEYNTRSDNPDVIFLTEIWESFEHQQAHQKSVNMQKLRAIKEKYIESTQIEVTKTNCPTPMGEGNKI